MKLFLQLTFKQLYHFLTTKYHRTFIYLALRYGGKKRFVPQKIKVAGFTFHVPDCASFIWQFKDIFADRNYAFPSPENPIILDCGANVGSSVAFFKREYPHAHITAYEADKAIFSYLEENVKRNNFHDITLINKAIWTHNEGIEIGSEGADGGGIFSEEKRHQVDSIRLSEELEKFKTIDLLKIDIEGAETEVIKDCEHELHRIHHIFIEYHSYVDKQQDLGEILQILEQQNFRYFIKSEADREQPFLNRKNKSNPPMDLQLNIFAYRS